MAPRDVGASRSSQCDWRDSRSPPSPFARIAIPSTLSFTPQHPLSHVTRPSLSSSFCMCAPISFSPSFHQWLHQHPYLVFSFLSYFLSLSISPFASCILPPPSSLEISLCLFLFLSFTLFHPHSPFLLGRSIYPYFFLSVAPFLLALSRASPSVPRQPSRHWPSWSREHQLGQSYARWRHSRGLSRTARERSRGRKGAFVDSGGRHASYGVGMDSRSIRSMDDVWCNGGTIRRILRKGLRHYCAGLLVAILPNFVLFFGEHREIHDGILNKLQLYRNCIRIFWTKVY